jgi:hypothetical protein
MNTEEKLLHEYHQGGTGRRSLDKDEDDVRHLMGANLICRQEKNRIKQMGLFGKLWEVSKIFGYYGYQNCLGRFIDPEGYKRYLVLNNIWREAGRVD